MSKNRTTKKTASILDSVVQATKEVTRTGAINGQAQIIKNTRTQEQETLKDVGEQ